MAGLQADVKVFLDPTQDGITQITKTLGQYQNLTGIDIISHGNVAELQLGNRSFNITSLPHLEQELRQWSASLAPGADILLYGCNVARGEAGQDFIKGLSDLTGANVAASTDPTGARNQGGNWDLEYSVGSIETPIPLSEALINTYQGLLATSLFAPTATPAITNATDGVGSNGDYELGMEFRSATTGQISAIRYYKASSETGAHTGKIWSSTGQLLASITFTNETASGWQEQALTTPLALAASTTYVVSVNANSYYVATPSGLATTLTNGDLSAVADGSNGVFNANPGAFPTQSFSNTNYFRDVVFASTPTNPNNNPGNVTLSGTATQNQTLSATVSDGDGLSGVTISYQWQQSPDGTTWTNITGATTQTFTLSQAQVNQRVRARSIYTDALGSSETVSSPATTAVLNVNDLGTVTINGTAATGNILTAIVADPDGLGTITYQWQQSSNGTTWTNIAGATSSTLTLNSTLLNQRVRINAIYTDALQTTENILSTPTSPITTLAQSPIRINTGGAQYTDGLGQLWLADTFFSGGNTYSTGNPIGGTTDDFLFQSERWGNFSYNIPVANGTYNINLDLAELYWTSTNRRVFNVSAEGSTVTSNLDIYAQVGKDNAFTRTINNVTVSDGVLNLVFTGVVDNAKVDAIEVLPVVANPNNNPGNVTLSGTATQNQTLTASVSDTDGLSGVTITYQWQQSTNGTTWTNITGATNQTFTLGQAQVNNQVRAQASYTDVLGSSESVNSNPTTAIANVNDLGTIAIGGITAQGNILTATVNDADGLSGTIAYQWQQSSNGTTWNNITGATNQTITLGSNLVGQQVRVNASYTDVLGGTENVFSNPTSSITAVAPTQSLFTTQTPTTTNATDGAGSAGDYELGMEFRTARAGTINAIRYYKATSETGTHVGRIWSSTGTLLASVTFTSETGSGWQQQALTTPLTIAANTTYVVSVNANSYYVTTNNGIATTLTNGDISAVADGSNGVYNETPTAFPTQSYQNSNYFRDIVFTPTNPVNNTPGTITIAGSATENQTLNATVADPNGLTGVTITYQWQQFENSAWTNITGATTSALTLGDAQVGKQVRARAIYTDALGTNETIFSNPTTAVVANVNDLGFSILKGSATVGQDLTATIFDADGLPAPIAYQWQQFVNNTWTNIAGATTRSLVLTNTLLGLQVRALATYIDGLGSSENVASSGATIAAQNAIVLENQKTGTRNWEISNSNLATNEISGYGNATSINKGQSIDLKISLAQAGQYRIDVYRLGYYGGNGGRLVTSATGLNGLRQADPTITNSSTKLVEYNWNTSYTLQTGSDWTTGLYFVKMTDSRTGKQNYIQFVLRDDGRPADIGFQDAITTAAAYNNNGGFSTYDFNSSGGRAYQVSFDRPFQYNTITNPESFNNTLTWEYNMTRWLESQGYDISYYSNLDVHSNPLQLYSQNAFLSVGHDEYWSMDMFDNVEQARDNGINLAFFSANTAYWQVRFDSSTSGQANRVMTIYKDSSGIGSNPSIDPIAQTNPAAATTLFRSSQVNRPENSLLGVGYIGDWGAGNLYNGRDFVVSNAADPYYANTGLQNGNRLSGLVGYEWDGVLNNGLTPAGLVVLSQSPVPSGGLIPLGLLPPGTNDTISNSVRYTAPSGAKVFSTGSVQWVWGLDSDRVTNPRVDVRAQQIAVNVFSDMGAKPQTPDAGIVVA